MKYVSVDIETTGTNPLTDQILEIGAVFDDTNSNKPVEERPYFHCLIDHERITGNVVALAMNSKIINEINEARQKNMLGISHSISLFSLESVVIEFEEWLREQQIMDSWSKKVTFCGKNFGSFDLQFLKMLPNWTERIRHHYRIIEPAILFVQSDDQFLPSLDLCKQRAGLPKMVSHRALDDALDVAKLVRIGLNRMGVPWKAGS